MSARRQALDEAHALGFFVAEIDLRGADRAGALVRIAAALSFPAYFGENLDALFDCLTDLSWLPAPGYCIALDVDAGHQPIVETFTDASEAWRVRGVPFQVVL